MIGRTNLSSRASQLDDELDVLLFDPVDEWLLDPIDQSRSQSLSYQMISSDKGIKLEASGSLIEEEMKRVKLEEEVVVVVVERSENMTDVKESPEMVKSEEEKEVEQDSEKVLVVKDTPSSMETKEIIGVKLEEEKVVQEESQEKSNVNDSRSSIEEKESAEVKSEESGSSSDEESSSEEEEKEEEEESSDGESSSSSAVSSESSDESSDDEKEKVREKGKEVEEGEIVMESDEEEGEDGLKGSTKSANEKASLPPVPKIDVQLEPHHQTVPVGEILSILGDRVIVEGSVKHNPLNEGSIVWVTQTRSPLGLVDEVFGPVKNPFYLIRYNSDEEVPPGISVGTGVSFVTEFVSYVLNNNKDIYQKGYDIGEDDIGDEVEFSDDEQEAEFKRALRQAKRGYNKSNERQSGPVKSRRNVNFLKKNDGNFTRQFAHPTVQSQQNQLPQNQFFHNQMPQNQFPQTQVPQYQMPQYQFSQTQMPQNQFPQNQLMQNQLPQNQMLQNQLLMNMSMLASGMQIPGFGLPMNTNPNPNPNLNPFMFGGMNFPPNMQFNPGNMQLNPGNMPSSGERPLMQGNSSVPNIHLNPVNGPFSGEQPPVQFQPGNLSMDGQSNLQSSPGSLSFGVECPMQFNLGHSGSLQFDPGNSGGEYSNLQFGPGNLSNRGGRPNQRGRGGRHFAGRNGNVRPRNG